MNKKLCCLVWMFLCVVSSNLSASENWTTIYSDDFGGNAQTDPLAGPSVKEMNAGLTFVNSASERMYGADYTVVKYYDSNSDWYTSGDHTNADNREKGYFVAVNPFEKAGVQTAYTKVLYGLEEDKTYRFSVWVANLFLPNKAGSSLMPNVGVGVYSDGMVVNGAYKTIELPCATISETSSSLDWQKVEVEFTPTQPIDTAYFSVVMDRPKANGWDFAIDDILIEFTNATGVDDFVNSVASKVYASSGMMHVESDGEVYEVYSLNGTLLYKGVESALPLPKGSYVVVMKEGSAKVIVP